MSSQANRSRMKWHRRMAEETAKRFRNSQFYLSGCQCEDHSEFRRGYLAALRDLGMFLEEDGDASA